MKPGQGYGMKGRSTGALWSHKMRSCVSVLSMSTVPFSPLLRTDLSTGRACPKPNAALRDLSTGQATAHSAGMWPGSHSEKGIVRGGHELERSRESPEICCYRTKGIAKLFKMGEAAHTDSEKGKAEDEQKNLGVQDNLGVSQVING